MMGFNDFERKRPSFFGYFVSALLGAVVGSFLVLTLGPAAIFKRLEPQATTPPAAVQQQDTQPTQQVMQTMKVSDISSAANMVMPSVVGIKTTTTEGNIFNTKQVQGVGSGIIIDKDGYILTNNHVAGMTSKNIVVSLYDGSEVPGETVWADPVLDLSIVKIENNSLTPAILGDSRSISIGEPAIAVGNPLGLTFQRTVTAGIISAVNRTIEVNGDLMEDLIQTDASINPGNSGGPLTNINGEVIGVNTIKVTSAEGIGFAVPINIIKPVIKSIKETGSFTAPVMGLKGFDKELAGYYSDKIVTEGIYITGVNKDSPADKAGIKEGDIILSINNETVNTMIGLKEILYNAGAESTVTVKVRDSLGEEKDIEVTLEAGK